MTDKTLWTPSRRELLLAGGLGLIAGCGGSGAPAPTPTPTPTPSPSPSPGGRRERFGFVEFTGSGYRLASARIDGTDYQPIPMAQEPNIIGAHWSPDGKRIAYAVQDLTKPVGSQYMLYTIKADGTGRAFFTYGLEPRWSPDGKKIAYVVARSNYAALSAWNVETNAPAFEGDDPRPLATALGRPADFTNAVRPRWRNNTEVWVSYYASTLTTPTAPGKSLWGLMRYFSSSGSLHLASTERSIVLADFAMNDGQGMASVSNPAYGSSSFGDVTWIIGYDLASLVTNTPRGAGFFSPDGERLVIDRNIGKGLRLYDRSLKELGAVAIPNGTHLSWFVET